MFLDCLNLLFIFCRSPPPPALPDGPSHILSANSYQARDGRRHSEAPRLAYDPKALPSGVKRSVTESVEWL